MEMTVKELIEKLNELDGDREIRYMDREDGQVEIREIKEDAVVIYNRPKYWEYTEYEWDLRYYENADKVDANILSKRDIYVIW